jgi:hypothetical protein
MKLYICETRKRAKKKAIVPTTSHGEERMTTVSAFLGHFLHVLCSFLLLPCIYSPRIIKARVGSRRVKGSWSINDSNGQDGTEVAVKQDSKDGIIASRLGGLVLLGFSGNTTACMLRWSSDSRSLYDDGSRHDNDNSRCALSRISDESIGKELDSIRKSK